MMRFRLVAASFATVVVVTLVTMIVFLIRVGVAMGGDGEGWGGPEAAEMGKLVFGPVWMVLVAITLGVTGWRVLRTPTNYRLGMLGGSIVMYANLALVSTFYFWNTEAREDDGQDRFLEDGNEEEEEEQEERAAFVLSVVCLSLFVVYALLAGLVFGASKSIAHDNRLDESEINAAQATAHVDILSDGWKFLSIFSILAMGVTFIVAIISLFLEDAERMREEGGVWNFLVIIVWMLLVFAGLIIAGKRVLGRRGRIGQLEIGAFNGALYFFAGVTFLLAGLYGFTFQFGERRHGGEEDPIGSLWFAFLCFTFAVAYTAFAALVAKYHMSILHENESSVDSSNMFSEMGDGEDSAGNGAAARTDSQFGSSMISMFKTDKNGSAHQSAPMEKSGGAQMA